MLCYVLNALYPWKTWVNTALRLNPVVFTYSAQSPLGKVKRNLEEENKPTVPDTGCLYRQRPQSQAQGAASIALTRAPLCHFSSKDLPLTAEQTAASQPKEGKKEAWLFALANAPGFLYYRILGIARKRAQTCSGTLLQLTPGRQPRCTLLRSCGSQDRAAALLQPSGSSNPLPQRPRTRFCLPGCGIHSQALAQNMHCPRWAHPAQLLTRADIAAHSAHRATGCSARAP